MPTPNPAAMDFLLTRRSRPAKTLTGPAPDRTALEPILKAGMRTPDHGKLEPWRFVVLERAALLRIGAAVSERGRDLGFEQEKIDKERRQYDSGQICVAVIESPVASDKIPALEQTYSAGAACLAILNAALASGWGANWLSGWSSHDAAFVQDHLGLNAQERVAGLIFLGTETATPPERPRPDAASKVSWVSA